MCAARHHESRVSALAATRSEEPPLPLHPSVFSVALQQSIGAQLTDIQATNQAMFLQCKYEYQPSHEEIAKSSILLASEKV